MLSEGRRPESKHLDLSGYHVVIKARVTRCFLGDLVVPQIEMLRLRPIRALLSMTMQL